MRFADGEQAHRHFVQPVYGVLARQPFGREVEQPVLSKPGSLHGFPLFTHVHTAVNRRRNTHQ